MLKTYCCLCREAAASSANKGRKKTPEELSVEVLLHFAGTVRAFYASVAKAVHAQARRRDDPSFQPTASMKAASVTLGVILTRNLNPPNQVTDLYRVANSQQSAFKNSVTMHINFRLVLMTSCHHCLKLDVWSLMLRI